MWVVYSRRKVVFVHQPDQPMLMLTGPQAELDDKEVVPGFKLKLNELFG